jgi:cation transport ATPase
MKIRHWPGMVSDSVTAQQRSMVDSEARTLTIDCDRSRISVRPGESIALDGAIRKGDSMLDEATHRHGHMLFGVV